MQTKYKKEQEHKKKQQKRVHKKCKGNTKNLSNWSLTLELDSRRPKAKAKATPAPPATTALRIRRVCVGQSCRALLSQSQSSNKCMHPVYCQYICDRCGFYNYHLHIIDACIHTLTLAHTHVRTQASADTRVTEERTKRTHRRPTNRTERSAQID